jgi:hypothetical protein
MPQVRSFHSTQEKQKPLRERVYHNNDGCPPGRRITREERCGGDGGYRLCHDCTRRNVMRQ